MKFTKFLKVASVGFTLEAILALGLCGNGMYDMSKLDPKAPPSKKYDFFRLHSKQNEYELERTATGFVGMMGIGALGTAAFSYKLAKEFQKYEDEK